MRGTHTSKGEQVGPLNLYYYMFSLTLPFPALSNLSLSPPYKALLLLLNFCLSHTFFAAAIFSFFFLFLPQHQLIARSLAMSSRRTRISEEEISELVAKLQSLLPENRRRGSGRASASKLLKETCNYIKSLHREVDDLSDRLSDLMSTMDNGSEQAEIIRSLLRS